jgi:hypothetical protein
MVARTGERGEWREQQWAGNNLLAQFVLRFL